VRLRGRAGHGDDANNGVGASANANSNEKERGSGGGVSVETDESANADESVAAGADETSLGVNETSDIVDERDNRSLTNINRAACSKSSPLSTSLAIGKK